MLVNFHVCRMLMRSVQFYCFTVCTRTRTCTCDLSTCTCTRTWDIWQHLYLYLYLYLHPMYSYSYLYLKKKYLLQLCVLLSSKRHTLFHAKQVFRHHFSKTCCIMYISLKNSMSENIYMILRPTSKLVKSTS
jgi:hypothetical protein